MSTSLGYIGFLMEEKNFTLLNNSNISSNSSITRQLVSYIKNVNNEKRKHIKSCQFLVFLPHHTRYTRSNLSSNNPLIICILQIKIQEHRLTLNHDTLITFLNQFSKPFSSLFTIYALHIFYLCRVETQHVLV